MFMNNRRFSQLVKDWDVSNVTNMNYMFYSSSEFDKELCVTTHRPTH